MRVLQITIIGIVASLLASCAQQQVASRVDDHVQHEGMLYADEVDAQSPFKTLEVSWSGAVSLMEERNVAYRKAVESLQVAEAPKPVMDQLKDQLQDSVGESVRDVLNPGAIVKSLQDPLAGLPKQFGSISAIKDISHDMQQNVWSDKGDALAAKALMRKEHVNLYTMLSKGEVIEAELKRLENLEKEKPAAEETPVNPKQVAALQKWRASVEGERRAWLGKVRDFFNAEYYDVRFKKDDTALPTYSGEKAPDLAEWQRWCYLNRTQSLVKGLMSDHKKSKPVVPGTRMVRAKVSEVLERQPEYDVELNTDQVRGEVRKLIRNWREMKRAQDELKALEQSEQPIDLARAQKIYKLRHKEIEHASVVWLLDEHCWLGM